MIKNGPCRSRAENVLIFNTLFEKDPEIKGLRPYTETQKSHQQGRAIVPLQLYLFCKDYQSYLFDISDAE